MLQHMYVMLTIYDLHRTLIIVLMVCRLNQNEQYVVGEDYPSQKWACARKYFFVIKYSNM